MSKNENDRLSIQWLNGMVLSSPEKLTSLSEHVYFNQIEHVSDNIVENNEDISILLISGPSASTKTTTSAKLSERLLQKGIGSVVISLDNFFLDRDDLPTLPDGSADFESIHSIDTKTLRRCFTELLTKGESNFPVFDFKIGERSLETQHIKVSKETIVIVEGIHALNPILAEGQDISRFRKIYISPNSDYYLDNQLILCARDVRLIRRLVRDYFHRANPIDNTMDMWTNVVESELINIIPYKTQADYLINSSILYEPNIYEYYLNKIIAQSDISETYRPKMEFLLKALSNFIELDKKFISENTVLREFLE